MKRILFVDDEQSILDGLRGRLYHQRKDWKMEFALGGETAIMACEQAPFDLIVTDLRMPGMDGGKLLEMVGQRWPQTVRIVLSGYSEQEQTMRVVRYAHQYLAKPCEPRQLENVIERCLKLQELLHGDSVRALVGRIGNLPAVPQTYAKLCDAMTQPDVSAEEVAKIIGKDMAISARLLQMVNSAFFRLARRITKIEQAVTYLGFAAIRNLVMSMEVFSQFKRNETLADFDPAKLQHHANLVSAAARALTVKTPLADDALLAGLLHDIGYLILVQECPKEFAAAVEESRQTGQPLHEVERRHFGASHAQIGAYLLGIWGLPYPIIEAVAHQNRPETVAQTEFDVLAALAVAKSLTMEHESSTVRALDAPRPPVGEDYWNGLHAPFDFAEARRRVSEVLAETTESEA